MRRVITEHRRYLVPIALVLLANLVVYAGVVYPLAGRVADASRRAAAADAARRVAQRELQAAQAVVTGKDRAQAELKTFYQQVLPANLGAASGTTYLSLAQLARKTNLRILRRVGSEENNRRDSSLGQWKIDMTLEGSYEDIRRFIYELETAPTFVVIDQMGISHGRDENRPLVLSLSLSTYYRALDNAS